MEQKTAPALAEILSAIKSHAELQSLREYIPADDTLLLEWAGVEEFNDIIQQLDEAIGFESSKDLTDTWTAEYREGFVDGLKRAKEIINDNK